MNTVEDQHLPLVYQLANNKKYYLPNKCQFKLVAKKFFVHNTKLIDKKFDSSSQVLHIFQIK